MVPAHPVVRQAIAIERARRLDLLWQHRVALRQLVDESQPFMQAARPEHAATLHRREVGAPAAPPSRTTPEARLEDNPRHTACGWLQERSFCFSFVLFCTAHR
jgi:hypothetical protein